MAGSRIPVSSGGKGGGMMIAPTVVFFLAPKAP
jgi:hypothetical protein